MRISSRRLLQAGISAAAVTALTLGAARPADAICVTDPPPPPTVIATSTTVGLSSDSVTFPGSVTATATVTAPGGVPGKGRLRIQVDGQDVASSVAGADSFQATIGPLDAGGHNVQAFYSGDEFEGGTTLCPHDVVVDPSTSTVKTVMVSPEPVSTNVAVEVAPASPTDEQQVTMTAHVTGSATPNAGAVTFGVAGRTLVAGVDGGGVASATFDPLPFGSQSVTVAYGGGVGGNFAFGDSSTAASLSVSHAPLHATPSTITAFRDVEFTGPVAAIPDPRWRPSAAPPSIDWGDGTASTGTVTRDAGGPYEIGGMHTYTALGTSPVAVTVQDIDGSLVTIRSSAQIGESPAPATTIALTPAGPTGQHGWYVGPVHARVAANGLGVPVVDTRCALDPPIPPATFDALPGGCPFGGAGQDIAGDGPHALYAASLNSVGERGIPAAVRVDIDATPPALTCAPAPTFVLPTTEGTVKAAVTDALSHALSATASARADLSRPGRRSVDVTGYDNAGNAATASCPYRVVDHIGSTLAWAFRPRGTATRVVSLVASDVPSGARIAVTCRGRGCPFRARTSTATRRACTAKRCKRCARGRCGARGRTADLSRLFRSRSLAARTRVTVAIAGPDAIGKRWTMTMRRHRNPSVRITCLAVGSLTAGGRC
jgi:hypothetical protein